MEKFFKSVLEMDRASVVLCDLEHTIIYMNPAAKLDYKKWGGEALVGKSLLNCHSPRAVQMIQKIVDWFAVSRENNMIHTFYNAEENKDVYMVALRDESGALIGYYEKHEHRNKETAKLYDFERSLV